MRAAIYFTPPADDPLARAAALWLGRDAFSDAPTRPPDPSIDPLVADPARYGFHATVRAPFRLAEGVALADARNALLRFVANRRAFALPRLVLARLGGFQALVPDEPSAAFDGLEGDVLEAFEPFRAPLTEAERARRRPERLTERQRGHLDRWGYPFVREDFRFHMTLTGSLDEAAANAAEAELRRRFGSFEGRPLRIDALALFVEDAPSQPFRVALRAPFGR
jgi:putative phosphonate metabolism protein